MVAPLVHAALTLAELVPSITRWFSQDKAKAGTAESVATKVVDIAKKVTGTEDAIAALKRLEKDPALLIRF